MWASWHAGSAGCQTGLTVLHLLEQEGTLPWRLPCLPFSPSSSFCTSFVWIWQKHFIQWMMDTCRNKTRINGTKYNTRCLSEWGLEEHAWVRRLETEARFMLCCHLEEWPDPFHEPVSETRRVEAETLWGTMMSNQVSDLVWDDYLLCCLFLRRDCPVICQFSRGTASEGQMPRGKSIHPPPETRKIPQVSLAKQEDYKCWVQTNAREF